MSVRKRKWTTRSGEAKEAWIVDYADQEGDRHIETFERKKDADAYAATDRRRCAGGHAHAGIEVDHRGAGGRGLDQVGCAGGARGLDAGAVPPARAPHHSSASATCKLASLTTPRINAFRDDLLTTMSRAMARKVLSSLKSLLRDAQRRGNVAQNVALGVKRIDADKRGKGRLKVGVDIPTTDEIKAIIAAAGRWRPLLLTAIFTGLARDRSCAACAGRTSISRAASCTCASAPTATT